MSEIKIPQSLLNIIADVNIEEINSHIYTNERMINWLCTWHEEVKRELYDFANNHELYKQGQADLLKPYDVESIEELIENSKNKARKEALEEILNAMHEVYNCQFYCDGEFCKKDEYGYDCEDCMYKALVKCVEIRLNGNTK